jgi:lipopolysaccharide transport system permease protein
MTTLARDFREMVAEQIEYRELLVQMTKRDLMLRYKQTVMGFGWAIFTPLINTIIFSVIFMRVAPIETPVPYPVFAYTGMLAWTFFASSLKFAVASLSTNTTLITKVYFPREIFPVAAVMVCLVDFAVASTVLAGLMAWYGIGVSWTILFLPVVILVQLIFTIGIAMLLAMANLFYRDVKYLLEVVITVWMFATSVVYPVELVGGRLGSLLQWNPMTPIIDAHRAVILRGELPAPGPFLVVAIASVAILAAGWLIFHRGEYKFAENV